MSTDRQLYALAEEVGNRLEAAGLELATAESCTGGWIAKALTDVAGSSAWLGFGFVSYSNAAKQTLLGISPTTLDTAGAVSAETVAEMATGALERSGADLAVAVSGIAGPTGAVAGKPVGTVWFAWARRGAGVRTQLLRFDGDRETVRRETVARALTGLLEELG